MLIVELTSSLTPVESQSRADRDTRDPAVLSTTQQALMTETHRDIGESVEGGSFKSAPLRAAANLMPESAELRVESIRDIPLYDGDLEAAKGRPDT